MGGPLENLRIGLGTFFQKSPSILGEVYKSRIDILRGFSTGGGPDHPSQRDPTMLVYDGLKIFAPLLEKVQDKEELWKVVREGFRMGTLHRVIRADLQLQAHFSTSEELKPLVDLMANVHTLFERVYEWLEIEIDGPTYLFGHPASHWRTDRHHTPTQLVAIPEVLDRIAPLVRASRVEGVGYTPFIIDLFSVAYRRRDEERWNEVCSVHTASPADWI